nr:reverse transcriptase domain-containing protein [Tanacetum cinerariifolium]
MEEIDLSFTPDDPMPPDIEEDDYDSERDMLIFEKLLSNDSNSLPKNESFHFDIPSFPHPHAKPPDDDSRILSVKMVGDIFEHDVPMPKLLPTQLTLVSNQEKSPHLLSHRGFKASHLHSESQMMIYRGDTPHLDEEIRLIEKLLYDNSSPRPSKEFISKNSDAAIESFSPFSIPVEDGDSPMEEIDLSFTPDDPMPPDIEEDDYDSERDMLIFEKLLSNDSNSLPKNESFHFDIPSFPHPHAKPPNDDSRILSVKMVEFISKNSDAAIESFSPFSIPVEDSDSPMEEIDLSFTPDDPMPPDIEEDDYDSERDMLIFEKLLSNDSNSLPKNESFHFDIPSFPHPHAKPPDDDSRILSVKMVGDIFEHDVPMPKLLPTQLTLVSNQEKSPHLLSHRGFKASHLHSESQMMIYRGDTPHLDAKAQALLTNDARVVISFLKKTLLPFGNAQSSHKRPSEVNNNFLGETLMEITTKDEPWFADFANYLVGDIIPKGMTYQQKNKFFSDLKNYYWEDPYLFKVRSDGMIRRCGSGPETHTILDQCHHGPTGGHYGPNKTSKKVLVSGFYWPTIIKEAHNLVRLCEAFQKTGNISKRYEIQVCEIFDIWGIDL